LQDPISKKYITKKKKRAGGVAQGIGPEFKLQYHKKKKEVGVPVILATGRLISGGQSRPKNRLEEWLRW
jgi:hypothetical protein